MDDASLLLEKPFGQFLGHKDVCQAIKDTISDPAFVATVKNDAAVLAYMSGADFTKSLEVIREELKPLVAAMK